MKEYAQIIRECTTIQFPRTFTAPLNTNINIKLTRSYRKTRKVSSRLDTLLFLQNVNLRYLYLINAKIVVDRTKRSTFDGTL